MSDHSDSDISSHSNDKNDSYEPNNPVRTSSQKPRLQTTEVDMMVPYFANTGKLITEERRVLYGDKPLAKISEEASSHSDNHYGNKRSDDGDDGDYGDDDDDLDNLRADNNTIFDEQMKVASGPAIYTQQSVGNHDQNINGGYDDTQNPHIKASRFGPSFGEGKSYGQNPTKMGYDPTNPQAKEEDVLLEKLNMLRKLGELTQYGVRLSQNYNMASDVNAMKYEYELHRNIRDKQNGIKLCSGFMMNAVSAIEFLNGRYNPFQFKLKGWAEHMNSEIADYYDIFGELYEKYGAGTGRMAPELKLLLMVSSSAVQYHLTNTMFKTLPNLDEALKNNPQVIKYIRN
jgi:hypothetical protein